MMDVYGIRNCESVKKALAWLDANGADYRFHDLKKEPPTPAQVDAWLAAVGWETLLNRKGTTWRKLPEDVRERTTDAKAARALMLANASIIKRPVVVKNSKVAVGFDTDALGKFL